MLSGMGDKLMVGAVFTAAVMGKPVFEAQSLQLWQTLACSERAQHIPTVVLQCKHV